MATVPGVLQVGHRVAETLDLDGAHLDVEGEVREVHGAGRLDGQPHAPEYLPRVHDPQELVLGGGLVEQGNLFVDKECVRDPNLFDILGSNNQLFQISLTIKSKSWIVPELSEVHVEGEVHELLRQVSDGEHVEGDSYCDRLSAIVWTNSSVVTNLERVQDVRNIHGALTWNRTPLEI